VTLVKCSPGFIGRGYEKFSSLFTRRENVKNDERSGCSRSPGPDENVQKVRNLEH
jgi:hypothetical protein